MLKCFAVLCLVALTVNAFEFDTARRSNRMNQLHKTVGARMLAGTVTPGTMGMMDQTTGSNNQFVPTQRASTPNIANMQKAVPDMNNQQLTPDQLVQLRQFMSSPSFPGQGQQQQQQQQQQNMMPPQQQMMQQTPPQQQQQQQPPMMQQTPPQQQQQNQQFMQQQQQQQPQNNLNQNANNQQQFRMDATQGMMNQPSGMMTPGMGMNTMMNQQQPQFDAQGRMMMPAPSTVSSTTFSTTTPVMPMPNPTMAIPPSGMGGMGGMAKPSPMEQQLLDQQVRMQNQIQFNQANNGRQMPNTMTTNTAVPSQMQMQQPVNTQMQQPMNTQMQQPQVQTPGPMMTMTQQQQPGQLHPSQIQAQQQIQQTVQQQQQMQAQQKMAQNEMMQNKINSQQQQQQQFFNQQNQLAQQQQATQQRISSQQQMSMPSTKLPGQQFPTMPVNNTLAQPFSHQPIKQQIPVSESVCANVQMGDLVPHPADPTSFVICYGFGEFTVMDCPDHTVYNAHLKRCDVTTELPMLCKSSPCQNGAKCTELSPVEFKCECPNGFGGSFCEKLDTCTTRPCGAEGVCLSFALGSPVPHVCLCNGGRSVGLSCDRAEANPCLAPGSSFKMMPVQFNTGVFAHCEGARPHFKFCQPPLIFSAAKGTCEWSA